MSDPRQSISVLPRLTRRRALQVLAAHLPLALTGCGKPAPKILPYVAMPDGLVPGVPLQYATVLPLAGIGRGVLVTSVDGRPIKIEGNGLHPQSLGATDVFAQAEILSLYDPDRARVMRRAGEIVSWNVLQEDVTPHLVQLRQAAGEGLALVIGDLASPTLARQLAALRAAFPRLRLYAHEPSRDGEARAGARLAFGRDLSVLPRLERAETVVCIGADPLGPGPDQVLFNRAFSQRRASTPGMRLHCFESTLSLTGAKSDHRLALPPGDLDEALIGLARSLGAETREPHLDAGVQAAVARAAADLKAPSGRGVVLGGRGLSRQAHALVHWINHRIGAPVDHFAPVEAHAGLDPGDCATLADDLEAGRIELLVTLGTNLAYDAPGELRLDEKLGKARWHMHASEYPDETSVYARWQVALSHPLESWSDLCARDGTAAICQPLIEPLHATRGLHEVAGLLLGEPERSAHDIVRQTWQTRAGGDVATNWTTSLRKGVIDGTAQSPVAAPAPPLPDMPPYAASTGLTLCLSEDPCVFDGNRANNAWLQELPKPLTKQVWGHALEVAPQTAERLHLATGDRVLLKRGNLTVEVPVLLTGGLPSNVLSITLGYGRSRAGAIGTGIGANAYRLLDAHAHSRLGDISLVRTGQREEILLAQHLITEPDVGAETFAKLFPIATPEQLQPVAPPLELASLYPDRPRPPADHQWAMVIDSALCTGCNACVVACQSENNIPVVGPQEIEQGRQMHWLRVDVYELPKLDDGHRGFQPVPCMHCEKAPCEPVCPVAASVHDGEGLNVQVYNRCIGTRFCEANCPYKVRRFNFQAYADGEEYANLGADLYRAQKNPDVTVRTRGVMEKCTYCIQRISGARRRAEREDRALRPDEVVTACAGACPTSAITFGDLQEPAATVNARRKESRHFALRADLGTYPRTTYLADVRSRGDVKEGGE